MTREETLYCMKANSVLYSETCEECPLYGDTSYCFEDALDEVIKELEQRPGNDMVSLGVFEQVMWERDVAIDQLKQLGYGLGEKIRISDDAVNRQAVLDIIRKCHCEEWIKTDIGTPIEALPPVKPQEPKTGHWIHFAAGDDCSECGWGTGRYISPSKYCPGCGARMVELQESILNIDENRLYRECVNPND